MRATRRRVHRSDENAKEIISAARRAGVFVIPIGRPTDLLCGICGRWYVVEIKTTAGKYTSDQKEFLNLCAVDRLPVLTWRSVDDVMRAINSIQCRNYFEVSPWEYSP